MMKPRHLTWSPANCANEMGRLLIAAKALRTMNEEFSKSEFKAAMKELDLPTGVRVCSIDYLLEKKIIKLVRVEEFEMFSKPRFEMVDGTWSCPVNSWFRYSWMRQEHPTAKQVEIPAKPFTAKKYIYSLDREMLNSYVVCTLSSDYAYMKARHNELKQSLVRVDAYLDAMGEVLG